MKHPLNDRGSILLVFLITLPFVIAICLYYTELSLTSFQVARLDQLRTGAQLAADAGADYAIQQISEDNDWLGTAGSEVTLHSDSQIKTTYEIAVDGDDIAKTVSVIGRTYAPVTAAEPERTVKIYVDLRPVSSGVYSVISGAGGLFMSNSSKIVGGDVFINGEINMSNSAQIGLSTKSVNVKVAHQICPKIPDTTFPRVCANGENGEPIALSNSAHIYGEVLATNQTNGGGMSDPGLVANSTVAPQALPTYDRTAHKAAATNNMTAAAASCSGNNATRTWPANTKITGNVTVSNKCKVTVMGNIWITGSLSISNNNTELIVADSLGTTRPNIMVDGSGGITISNSGSLRANADGIGFALYTFYNTKTGCTPTPADCATVTGADLANSRSVTTISISNGGDATNSIFYAYWSQVQLTNSGQIGALVGQTIRLSNSGTITFGAALATEGDVTWVPKGYRRQ